MNDSRFEFKVGLFVAIGLALVALLVLNFTKGVTLFTSTYVVHVVMPTTAGLKPTADVMISGVPVGKVSGFALEPDGRSVKITLSILSKYKIRKGAVFHIDALGFLGDQYVEVTPPKEVSETSNPGDFLQNGEIVAGAAPFNMQEAVRSTSDLLDQARGMLKDLDQAITNLNRSVLNEQTLTAFGLAVSNLEFVSQIAVSAAHGADDLIQTNAASINSAITNMQIFSVKINGMADELDGVITTNRPDVNEAVKNLRDASASFKQIAFDLEAGKGPVGGLLKNEAMKTQIASAISNANAVTAEFNAFGSNLNERGIWSMLWKPKHKDTPGTH
jgi:phospholipid/cholesterol/gamma-HCH transport system substrate-binding protein